MFLQLFEYLKRVIYGTQNKEDEPPQSSELQHKPTDVEQVSLNINCNNATNDGKGEDGPIWFWEDNALKIKK